MEKIFSQHKFDAVFHCAALLAHVKKDLPKLWKSNVDGTQVVYDLAIEHNIKKIVFISSNCLWAQNFDEPVTEAEIPAPAEIYGKSKLAAEKILLSHPDKINSIIFRSPTIMDEGRLGCWVFCLNLLIKTANCRWSETAKIIIGLYTLRIW